MQDTLSTILTDGAVPARLTITYDDMHGLWGGTTITVRGDGSLVRQFRPPGATAPVRRETRIGQTLVLDLVRLLLDLRAWEQRVPARQPVPDESFATLTIDVEGRSSRMWEWFNDLAANNRLFQIKTWLEQVAATGAPDGKSQ